MSNRLDKTNLKVLYSLSNSARKTVTQISKETNLSRPTVIKKIKYLIKSNLINFNMGINIAELGFKLVSIFIQIKNEDDRVFLEKKIKSCPRVLTLLRITDEPNYIATVYAENTETIISVVKCFKKTWNVQELTWHRSRPIIGQNFNLRLYDKKEFTPCGKKCNDCSSYRNNECFACPAVTEYRGLM